MSEPKTHTPPPPYTLYRCIHAVYLFTLGRGEGEGVEAKRRLEGKHSNLQSWVENTNKTDCLSSLKTLVTPAAKSLYRSVFLNDDILLRCLF